MMELMDLISSLPLCLQLGLLYSVLAMGYYVSYSILDFPDLTVEGTFLTGGVVFALCVHHGISPWLGLIAALLAGALGGALTGILHVKLHIRPLLCGILVSTALITVNIILATAGIFGDFTGMESAEIPFRQGYVTLMDRFFSDWIPSRVGNIPLRMPLLFLAVALVCKFALDLYLKTKNGLLLRSTGDNEQFVKLLGVDPGKSKIIGLALGNGFAAISGALFTHTAHGVSQSMGVGMVIVGLASLIIGLSVFKKVRFLKPTTKVILGSILYQGCLIVVQWFGVPSNYNKLIMAALFTVVLVLSSRKGKGAFKRVVSE